MSRLLKSIFLISFVFCSTAAFAEEEITITTYYPSPYGSYNSLQTDKLGVGDNNGDGSLSSADVPTTSGDLWVKGNVGIGTGTKALAYKLDVNGGVRLGTLNFTIPGGDSGQSNNYYGIYQESGAWVHPYPDLRIQYHTGIKYDAYYGYGGHRFYTGYDGTGNPAGLTFSVGDGDQNVRVANTLITGGLQMVSGAGAGKVLTSDASGVGSWQAGSGAKVFQETSGYEGGVGVQTYCINKGYSRAIMLRYWADGCAVNYDCCTMENTFFDWTHLILDTDNSVIYAGTHNGYCAHGGPQYRQTHNGFQIMCSK